MIPKIYHQVWLGDKEIPEQEQKWLENWRKLHPDWEYKLWTDKDIPETLKPLVEMATNVASASTVVRTYAVYTHGGVYSDTDFDWNKNINGFLSYSAFAAKEAPHRYGNAFFGAVKKHPCWKWQMENLHKYAPRNPPWGPTMLTDAIKNAGENVHTLPTGWVYPYRWGQSYKPASNFPDAYLVHHWNKRW